MPHRDASGIVPATRLGQTLGKGFDRATFPKLRTVDQNQPTLARRRRFVRLKCHASVFRLLCGRSSPTREGPRRSR
ncbi:NAD(FAD)-dependent dehydrogenase [Ketogulonicigenium robustum]|uniref:NAD(FAD)-dependent dehydrogenase n=1 Tax=Ketogulonicigenium robustum TaxID=92947 RepID=A0A1W6P2I5_9RHOB|nr:NAD(FAD)-dependent dehydrogenase [Ketogulonicigenium robustum]